MDELLTRHPDSSWNEELQLSLNESFKLAVSRHDWITVEKCVNASRSPEWRAPLCHLVLPMLDFVTSNVEDVMPTQYAIRLAANCIQCDDSVSLEVQERLVKDRLDTIIKCLDRKDLFGLTLGLLYNLLNVLDEPVLSLTDLLDRGTHVVIAAQLRNGALQKSDSLYGVAVDLIEDLAKQDERTGAMDAKQSASACILLMEITLSLDSGRRSDEEMQIFSAIVHFATSDKVIDHFKSKDFLDFINTYREFCLGSAAYAESDDKNEELVDLPNRYQRILCDVGERLVLPEDELAVLTFIHWLTPQAPISNQLNQLYLGGLLALGNVVQNESSAEAVAKLDPSFWTLLSPFFQAENGLARDVLICATQLVSNLAAARPLKENVCKLRAIPSLIERKENAMAIHILRKLVCNWEGVVFDLLDQNQADAKGLPFLPDVLRMLPDQQSLQEQVQKGVLSEGPGSDTQLSIDIGHIIVCFLRYAQKEGRSLRSAVIVSTGERRAFEITEEHVRCLLNLIELGLRNRRLSLTSQGVLGLALALRDREGVRESLALFAIDLLAATEFKSFKAVLATGKEGESQVAKRDADNAMIVLALLRDVAKADGLASAGVIDSLLSGDRSLGSGT